MPGETAGGCGGYMQVRSVMYASTQVRDARVAMIL